MSKESGSYNLPALTDARLQLLRGFNIMDKFGRKKPEKNSDVYARIFLHTFEKIPESVLPMMSKLDEADGQVDLEQRVKEVKEELDKFGTRRTKPIVKQTCLSKAESNLIDGEARGKFFAKLRQG